MDLRDNISERRRASNLTQEDVASRLGVSRQTIGKWESGKATPELDKLVALCDLLGCSLDELVGRAESEHEAESDVSIPNEEAANDSHENSAAEMASPDLPVEEESLRHGTATRYAAILAAGVWLVVASIGLLALLLGPSSVENVEVRRIVPVVAALGVGFGVVLIVAAQLYKAKCMQSGATEASMARRARVIAVIALAVIVAAVCALVALAPEMRTTAFICIEVAALAAWPIVFAVALAIDSRR